MRLHSLELRNFRQHRATDIAFFDGITGIIGRNGAGKSTLLEAIAWALYGQKAVQRMERGKADTIRSRGARSGEVPQVTLDFELGPQRFRVVRRLNDASLFSGDQQLHTGTENVTRAVGQLLQMDPQAFFTSFFTGQKDLAFLKDVSAKGREAYIGKLLGYERLTKARELANQDKLNCRNEIEGLVKGLADPDAIRQRKSGQTAQLKAARESLAEGDRTLAEARAALDAIAPELKQSQEKRARHEALARDIQLIESQAAFHREGIAARQKDLDLVSAAAAEVKELEPLVEEHERLKERFQELQELRAAEAERAGIRAAIEQTAALIAQAVQTIRSLEAAFAEVTALRDWADAAGRECAGLKAELAAAQDNWVGRRSGVEADLRTARTRRDELEEHLAQLAKAGPDGICPTCERPLGDEFEKVTGQMAKDLASAGDAIRTLESELTGLRNEPPELAELRPKLEAAESSLAGIRESITKAEGAGDRLKQEQASLAELRRQLAGSEKKLSQISGEFDPEEFDKVRARGRELNPVRERWANLNAQAGRRESVERELSQQASRLEELLKSAAEKQRELEALSFDEKTHAELISRHDAADLAARSASEEAARLRADVQTGEALLKAIEAEEADQKARAKLLDEKKAEHRHLEALVKALEDLRAALSEQIKPRLEEAASDFLAQVAPERYSQMDLDDDFAPRLYEEGDYKPVVSGGEEDILHLCLRLGVSQMIAERAGMELGLLILDEVFGSLDDMRRENVISLLQNLKGRFPQILLITHIESIHDMVDRCVWVDYDQQSQTSKVRDGRELPSLSDLEVSLDLS